MRICGCHTFNAGAMSGFEIPRIACDHAVIIQEVDEDLAHQFGMKDTHGALVAQVNDNSAAEKAGPVLTGLWERIVAALP